MNENERMVIGEQCQPVDPQAEKFKQNKKMVDDMFKELEDDIEEKEKSKKRKYSFLSKEERDALIDAADEAFNKPDRDAILLYTKKCISKISNAKVTGTLDKPMIKMTIKEAKSIIESLEVIQVEAEKIS